MSNPCCIPNYLAATREERRLREEIYLDIPHDICGIKVHHLTPRLFARLSLMESAVVFGGEITDGELGRFLWALSVDFTRDKEKRDAFLETVATELIACREKVEDECFQYLDATFLDASQGGRAETPYVCNCAWLEYTMSKDPFRWESERTLDTPLRRIYQLIRCRSLDNGGSLTNTKSDKVRGEWLADISARLNDMTPEERQAVCDQLNRRNN